MNEQQWIEKLEKEGYKNVKVCPIGEKPYTDFPDHTHDQTAVHVILEGYLTLTDKHGIKIAHQGEQFEIPAGTRHTAQSGAHGCRFIVGIKD